LLGQAVERKHIDQLPAISGPDAIRDSRLLAQKEGIFIGITASATFTGALMIAEQAEPGSNILCMLPDTGERYLTTPLFEGIGTQINAEEKENAGSTPNYQFDSPA
jgi:cysteine synthase A